MAPILPPTLAPNAATKLPQPRQVQRPASGSPANPQAARHALSSP
eukprot:CAMPEP_0117593618 /NCGR_PEP_ID=MMETSP0784-20121206/72736_1 /TAXON_ID=39447 /ORGANISM="" /LENGTH=44 /DNA_ID= /DNA_START= /DNA_END= /DNA_ORIENTATION=